MHTSCKDCKFAIIEIKDNLKGKQLGQHLKQTGCKLGRLEAWEKLGVLQEKIDDTQKDWFEYYTIRDRACNGYNPHKECSVEEARKIMQLQYTMILEYSDKIQEEVERINNYKIKPKEIWVVCEENGIELYKSLKSDIKLFVKQYNECYDLATLDVAARCETEYSITGESEDFVNLVEQKLNYELVHFIGLVGKQTCLETRALRYLGKEIFNHKLCLTV